MFNVDVVDGESDEAEERADPEEHGKTTEEISAKFDPFGGFLGWSESIWSITGEDFCGLFTC